MIRKITAAAIAVLTAGVMFAGDSPFRRTMRELDDNGTYLHIADKTGSMRRLKQCADELSEALVKSNLPDDNGKRFAVIVNGAMFALSLAGIDDGFACGMSSVASGGKLSGHELFRNRFFLCAPQPKHNGLLWQIFGRKNRSLTADLGAIPADALLAADFSLAPAMVFNNIITMLKTINGDSAALLFPPELVKTFEKSGTECGIVLLPLPVKNPGDMPFGVVMAIQDDNKALYKIIAAAVGADAGAAEFTLPVPGFPGMKREQMPRVVSGEDITMFYSSTQCMDKFAAADKFLKDTPEYRQLSAGLPTDGFGFLYASATIGDYLRQYVESYAHIALPLDFPAQLWVGQVLDDGLKVTGNSTWDYNFMELNFAMLPLLGALSSDIADKLDTAKEAAREKADREKCRLNMQKLAQAVAAYRRKHNKLPPGDEIAACRALLQDTSMPPSLLICPAADGDKAAAAPDKLEYGNLSYVYWGDWAANANPRLPVFTDWPANHKNCVNVLFNDGTLETLEVENLNSARRLAGFLHSRGKYSEDEFRRLMKLAEKLDKMFSE